MNHSLVFPQSITKWDEAVPLGNGKIGTLIWGTPEELRFSLDRTDIWDRTPPLHSDNPDFCYDHLVKLAKEGNTKEIRELFDAPYNFPTPTKLPAGKILFHFSDGNNIKSELNLQEALSYIQVQCKSKNINIKAFCHSTNKTGMIEIDTPFSQFSFTLAPVKYGSLNSKTENKYDPEHREISQGSLEQLHYPPVEEYSEEGKINFKWFIQKVQNDFSYGIVLGYTESNNKSLIFYRIATSYDSSTWIDDAKNQIKEEIIKGFELNLQSHKIWWENYWNKSTISLPDSFIEKQWYITNYLFASCSRKGSYPMPLQGVWTADDGNLPPWKGDYHNDLNTQFSYTHFYKANHLQEGESFIDFLWNLRNAGANFAKKFYKTEGICLPGVMTIDGKALGGWPMYSLSPTHQIWLCSSFINYYKYTGDEDFLKNKAWVYCRESGICISQLLVKKEDGFYYLPVSSSPEIHDDEKESWLEPNSNYDLSLLQYLYKNLVDFSKKIAPEETGIWQNYLDHLPPLSINEKKVLMLSPTESLNESHRHLSNAMAIYPLKLYSYDNKEDAEIIDATILDYERLGTGYWVGFSFPWMSHLYSIQNNGEGAYTQLRIFWENFCAPNGFHLNGDYKKRGYTTFHYRPFTLESNMLAADALQEMLFQMDNGTIKLFPAIPETWTEKKVSFTNFLGEKGLKVSATLEQGNIKSVKLYTEKPQTIRITFNNKELNVISLKEKEEKELTF